MIDLGSLFERGVDVAADHPVLAVVPLATSFLAVDNVRRVAGASGMHFGGKLPMPMAVVDLWTFVSIPQAGVNAPSAVPLVLLPVYVVGRGIVAAGYLGAIRDSLAGRPPAFVENVERYALPMVGFQVLVLGVVLALGPVAATSPLLLLPALAALVVVGYLFYGTPYLVVRDDEPLLEALEHSYRLATRGGPYAAFFVALLLGGGLLSVVATSVVVNLGIAGVVLGAVLAAPLGVAVNAAAMALFLDADSGATPTAGPRPDRRADGR